MYRNLSFSVYQRMVFMLSLSIVLFPDNDALGESEQKKRDRDVVRTIGTGAIIFASATGAGCLLVPKFRKMCVELLSSRAPKTPLQHVDNADNIVSRFKSRLDDLETRWDNFETSYNESAGRQANLNGFVLENDTINALPHILSEVYQGISVNKIVRNVEGHYALKNGKRRNFELDAIAFTDKAVFVIETKVSLKAKHVDSFVTLLENFPKIRLHNSELQRMTKGKTVHGGMSYMFDSPSVSGATERASSYARRRKRLLTIPRLDGQKVSPKHLRDLHDFSLKKR